jgi:hypothetical protein
MCHIWMSAAEAAPAADHVPCCWWSLLWLPPCSGASFDCENSSSCFVFLQNARTMVAEPTVLQKRCTKCRVTKAASEFFRFKFSSDGLQSYCKVGLSSLTFHALQQRISERMPACFTLTMAVLHVWSICFSCRHLVEVRS